MGEEGKLLLLMPPRFAQEALRVLEELGFHGEAQAVEALADLREAFGQGGWKVLLSFGTGTIVPADLLAQPGLHAYNIHAASPAYPGRDPHHFAAYDGVREYGATLHVMTPAVDQGPIVAVSTRPVAANSAPHELLACGNACGLELMRGLLRGIAAGTLPPESGSLRWTGPVRRRSDFLRLCKVEPGMSASEFERRLHACAMPGYANLWTEVHGRKFVLELPR